MQLLSVDRLKLSLPVMFFVMTLPVVSPANADWYLSMSGGLGSFDEEGDEAKRFRDGGHDVSEVDFDSRSGYGEVAVGWKPEPDLSVELGIAYIGNYEATVEVADPSEQEFARDALEIVPGEVASINLGIVFHLKLSERLTLQPGVAVTFWRREIDITTAAGTESESETGTGMKGGASLLWQFRNTWHLGVGWQNYLLDGSNIDVYALKLEKHF